MKKKINRRPAPKALVKLAPGKTLTQLSRESGVTVSSLSYIFRGKRRPRADNAGLIASALGISIEKLLATLSK